MAKKKNKSAKKITAKKVNSSKDSMLSKVEIKDIKDRSLSRLIGTLFIVIGLLLIGYGVFSFVKGEKNPVLDETLTPPSLAETPLAINGEEIIVKGEASGYKRAQIYLDNELVKTVRINKDGKYEYKHKIEGEGKYILSTAALKGCFKKTTTPKSDPIIVTVDRTAPELAKINYLEEVGTETFAITGEGEPNTFVIVKRGTDVYETEVGEDGKFVIKDITLRDDGVNVYSVVLKDEAGNTREVDEKVSVIYSEHSSVNGNAVIDSDLPVASGELELALSIIRDGKMMAILGLLALVAFLASSGVVILKRNRIA